MATETNVNPLASYVIVLLPILITVWREDKALTAKGIRSAGNGVLAHEVG